MGIEELGFHIKTAGSDFVTYEDRRGDAPFCRQLCFNKWHGAHWCCETSFHEFILNSECTWSVQQAPENENTRWSAKFGHWTQCVLCLDAELARAIADKLDELEANDADAT